MVKETSVDKYLVAIHTSRFSFAEPGDLVRIWTRFAGVVGRAPTALDPDEKVRDLIPPPKDGVDSNEMGELLELVHDESTDAAIPPEDCTVAELIEFLLRHPVEADEVSRRNVVFGLWVAAALIAVAFATWLLR